MRICVNGTANLCHAIREWFAYHSPRIEICQFFVRTQRELDALGILFMPWMSSARLRFAENYLTTHRTRMAQFVGGGLVYTKLNGKNAHIRLVIKGKHLYEKQFYTFLGEFDPNFWKIYITVREFRVYQFLREHL